MWRPNIRTVFQDGSYIGNIGFDKDFMISRKRLPKIRSTLVEAMRTIFAACWSKTSPLSMVTPKYLVLRDHCNGILQRVCGQSLLDSWQRAEISIWAMHLLVTVFSCHILAHSVTLSTALTRSVEWASTWKELYNLASPAYSLIEQFNKPTESLTSLMYCAQQKQYDSPVIACGTPLDIDKKLGKKLPILICRKRWHINAYGWHIRWSRNIHLKFICELKYISGWLRFQINLLVMISSLIWNHLFAYNVEMKILLNVILFLPNIRYRPSKMYGKSTKITYYVINQSTNQ